MARLIVQDYEELDRAPQDQDVEITVLSSGFHYQFRDGHWTFVGRSC